MVAPTPPVAVSPEDAVKAELASRAEAIKASAARMGKKILVSAQIANQENPLTCQKIPHGEPVIAVYDRWIEIQLDAKVLVEHDLT